MVEVQDFYSVSFDSGKRDDGELSLLGGDCISGSPLGLKVKGYLVTAFHMVSTASEEGWTCYG